MRLLILNLFFGDLVLQNTFFKSLITLSISYFRYFFLLLLGYFVVVRICDYAKRSAIQIISNIIIDSSSSCRSILN